MKPTVRTAYPFTKTAIVSGLRHCGHTKRKAAELATAAKPAYVSKSGWVKRWAAWPDGIEGSYHIIGKSAESLQVVRDPKQAAPRFSGSLQDCRNVLETAVREWWSLDRGREIEQVAAARIELPKAS